MLFVAEKWLARWANGHVHSSYLGNDFTIYSYTYAIP